MYIKDFAKKRIYIKNKQCMYVFSYLPNLDCFDINVYDITKRCKLLIDTFIISTTILDCINMQNYSFSYIAKSHPIKKDIFVKFRNRLTLYNGE